MNIEIVYPQNPFLKEYIQYFLFIEKNDSKKISQVCYPNTNHCLSLMKNSQLNMLSNTNYEILASKINTSYLTGIYKQPINISTGIPYKELCINFNPLGLEVIFGQKLSSILFENNPLDSDWEVLLEIAFSNNSIKDIQGELETFLIYKIRDSFINHQKLNLNEINSFMNVEDISDIMSKSYRSTHRFFKEQFQLTPKDFLQVKKVRSAMDLLFEDKSITEISYDLNFSDQSHFIKTFKNYTNLTPLQFRKRASTVEDTLIWNLEHL